MNRTAEESSFAVDFTQPYQQGVESPAGKTAAALERDQLESADAAAQAVLGADAAGQTHPEDPGGDRPRTGRLHLGDCPNGGAEIRLMAALTKRAWQARR